MTKTLKSNGMESVKCCKEQTTQTSPQESVMSSQVKWYVKFDKKFEIKWKRVYWLIEATQTLPFVDVK